MKQTRVLILAFTLLLSFSLVTVALVTASDPEDNPLPTERPSELIPEDTGGPDAFGYTYIDSNEPCEAPAKTAILFRLQAGC
jgi:hypothetical protein